MTFKKLFAFSGLVAVAASFIPSFGASGVALSGLTAAFAASNIDEISDHSVSNDGESRHEESPRESVYSERTPVETAATKPSAQNPSSAKKPAKTALPKPTQEQFFYEEPPVEVVERPQGGMSVSSPETAFADAVSVEETADVAADVAAVEAPDLDNGEPAVPSRVAVSTPEVSEGASDTVVSFADAVAARGIVVVEVRPSVALADEAAVFAADAPQPSALRAA